MNGETFMLLWSVGWILLAFCVQVTARPRKIKYATHRRHRS